MEEKILLLVLVFSEIFILSSCLHTRQYYYVNQSLSWTEAQTYCRQKHTDLATIETSEEMDQLMNAVSSAGYSSDFWIGLYNEIAWRWSDGFTGSFTGYTYWSPEDPFHSRSDQICMTAHWYFVYLYSTDVNGTKIYKGNKNLTTWRDSNCKTNMTFICYHGTQQNPEYVFVNERMNWSSAQRYCRENFTDLATFRNNDDWKKIPNLAPLDQKSWIGLYRDSNISWSDGNDFFFYKTPIYLSLQPNQITARCGGQHVRNTHDWYFHVCESRFPFVCYRELLKKHVVKLKLKTEDSAVLDISVREELLKQLQDKLEENGVYGVKLKWRQTTGGEVPQGGQSEDEIVHGKKG